MFCIHLGFKIQALLHFIEDIEAGKAVRQIVCIYTANIGASLAFEKMDDIDRNVLGHMD